MTIAYSVQVNASQGWNTVNLPNPGMLVGVMFLGKYVAIQLDPSRQAIVPGRTANPKTSLHDYFPVAWPINANSFQFYASDATTAVFYFGTPDGDAVPLDRLTGVAQVVSLTNSSSSPAGVSTTATFTFLAGARLTGAYLHLLDSNIVGSWLVSFTASPGYSLTLVSDNQIGMGMSLPGIVPLADLPVAQTLQVSCSAGVAANSTTNLLVIFYYRVG